MKAEEIENFVKSYLSSKLEQLGIKPGEIGPAFDFVQSGLLDSMAFVDMLSDMEKHFKVEIDFENEVENSSFTRLDGLTKIFLKANE